MFPCSIALGLQTDPSIEGADEDLRSLLDLLDNANASDLHTADSLGEPTARFDYLLWPDHEMINQDRMQDPSPSASPRSSSDHTLFRDMTLRMTITHRTNSDKQTESVNERTLIRWNNLYQRSGGTMGEVSVKNSDNGVRLSSATVQYKAPDGAWELAIGNVYARSSYPLLDRQAKVGLASVSSERMFISRHDILRKPSFRENQEDPPGIGGRIRTWNGIELVGTIYGRNTERRKRIESSWMCFGEPLGKVTTGIRVEKVGSEDGMNGMVFTQYRARNLGWSVGFRKGHGSDAGGMLYISSRPAAEVNVRGAAWAKSVPELSTKDEGFYTELRYRPAVGYRLLLSHAMARSNVHSGATVVRSFAGIDLSRRMTNGGEWKARYRIYTDEKFTTGEMIPSKRNDLMFSLSKRLKKYWYVRWKCSFVRKFNAGSLGTSGITEVSLTFQGSKMKTSLWSSVFNASTGVPVWSTQPGYLLWPIPAVYSGSGMRWGVSMLVIPFENVRLAAFVSNLVRIKEPQFMAGLLLQKQM